jgi:hypothetical protein
MRVNDGYTPFMRARIFLFTAILAAALCGRAGAEWIPIHLDEQADISDRIVIGRITSVTIGAEVVHGPRTDVGVLTIARVLKGPGAPGDTLTIAWDGNSAIICPRPRECAVGDEGIWFLTEEWHDGQVARYRAPRPEDLRSIEALPDVEATIAANARKDRSRFALSGSAKELFDLYRHGDGKELQSRVEALSASSPRLLHDVQRLYGSEYHSEWMFAHFVFQIVEQHEEQHAAWTIADCLSESDCYREMWSLCGGLMQLSNTPVVRVEAPEAGVHFVYDQRIRLESIGKDVELSDVTGEQFSALRAAVAKYWTTRLTELKIPR